MSRIAHAKALPEPSHASLSARLVAATEAARDGRIVHVVGEAPVGDPVALFGVGLGGSEVLFAPAEGISLVGIGECAVVSASGANRFSDVRALSEALFARVEDHDESAREVSPRLVGGFSFDVGRPLGAYAPLKEARFVLPRFTYIVDGDAAWLSVCVTEADTAEGLADTLSRIWACLEGDVIHPGVDGHAREVHHAEYASFAQSVEGALAAIDEGAMRKVVLARTSEVVLDAEGSANAVLARLGQRYPSCTRFAIAFEGGTFLGATPERLVAREHDVVTSEALAGSCARGEERSLLASLKNREEHAFVVEAILAALAPLCHDLRAGDRPELRSLHDVVHLRTPITGRSRDAHVLALVEALHPTPAVGGVPRADALSFIRAHEPMPRGYYAAPFGHFDARGQGAFVVALRSGLLQGDRATLHAGAGIVRGSSPRSEWDETALKMGALLGALSGEAV